MFLNCRNDLVNVILFKSIRIIMAFPVPISLNSNRIIYLSYITDLHPNRIVSAVRVWIELAMRP